MPQAYAKQLFTKTKTPSLPINLGKGNFMEAAMQTETIHRWVTQKPAEIDGWAPNKCYKTT
jgi:hypothetical protein